MCALSRPIKCFYGIEFPFLHSCTFFFTNLVKETKRNAKFFYYVSIQCGKIVARLLGIFKGEPFMDFFFARALTKVLHLSVKLTRSIGERLKASLDPHLSEEENPILSHRVIKAEMWNYFYYNFTLSTSLVKFSWHCFDSLFILYLYIRERNSLFAQALSGYKDRNMCIWM